MSICGFIDRCRADLAGTFQRCHGVIDHVAQQCRPDPHSLSVLYWFGANIGSGLIPLILTLRQPPDTARRIPLGNFLFRLVGCPGGVRSG